MSGGEAAYVTALAEARFHPGLRLLTTSIADTLAQSFGAFLLIEIWTSSDDGADGDLHEFTPRFRLVSDNSKNLASTLNVFEDALKQITTKRQKAQVERVKAKRVAPPDLRPLIAQAKARELDISTLGIEVRPVYRDTASGQIFPAVFRALHKGLARAIKKGCFEFTQTRTTHRPKHYQALGQRSLVKVVWEADRQLAKVSNSFDFLLAVTPTNTSSAWSRFKRRRFQAPPNFEYRPLPIDPPLIKRQLFKIPIERIEDPVLAQLFQAQQREFDRKLSMLTERDTKEFLLGSLQLYGGVSDDLRRAAEAILYQFPSRGREGTKTDHLDSKAFAERAEAEIRYYRQQCPGMKSHVEIREDVSGLMVSRGNLLVSAQSSIPSPRVDALLAHEVGTHVLTHINGHAQPFKQLYCGLPNYEELQEGLAVLAEYLAGGLSLPRLRLLAGRVMAVSHLVDGATFIDVYRELNKTYRFEQKAAFTIAMRIFRSGGFTKDAVYLRGLLGLLEYFSNDGDLEPLLLGKFSLDHLPIVKELKWCKVLVPPTLLPRYMNDAKGQERLGRLRQGLSVLDLVLETR